jgi:hypothetical protein
LNLPLQTKNGFLPEDPFALQLPSDFFYLPLTIFSASICLISLLQLLATLLIQLPLQLEGLVNLSLILSLQHSQLMFKAYLLLFHILFVLLFISILQLQILLQLMKLLFEHVKLLQCLFGDLVGLLLNQALLL